MGISAEAFAKAAKLGVTTIRRAELCEGPVAMTVVNVERAIDTLERLGVRLLPAEGRDGVGVRLFDSRGHKRRATDR